MPKTATVDAPTDSTGVSTVESDTALLTVAEVATELRLKPWAVYNLCRSGELPSVYLGPKSRRVKRSDLVAFIAALPDTRPE